MKTSPIASTRSVSSSSRRKSARKSKLSSAVALAVLSYVSTPAMAATITWGGSDQTGALSGTWNNTNTNVWLGGVIPGPTSDVVLDTVSTANRIVTLSGGTVVLSTTIASLTFNQTSAFTNELDMVGGGGKSTALTVGSTLMLGGNTSGTERLLLNCGANGAPTGNVTYVGNINVGANGIIEMNAAGQGNNYTPFISGSVVIQNGGKLNLDSTPASYLTASIKDLVLDGGATMTLNAAPSAGSGVAADNRFTITSSFVANTGATINAVTASGTTAEIFFSGSSGIFKSGITGSFFSSSYTSLSFTGTQSDPSGASVFTLASDTTLPAIKISPGSTTANIVNVTIGSYTPGLTLSATSLTIGSPINTSGHNGTTEVTLGSNVTVLSMGVNGQATGATIILNTNGHTFTLPNPFKTVSNSSSLINWTVNGGGTVKATGFDLSAGGLASTLGANTTLFATGTYANILSSGTGGGGYIDPTSTFVLSGSSASLLSSRAIGRLQVGTGSASVLSLSSTSAATSVLTVAGDVTVSANGTLDLNGLNLTGSSAAGSNAGGLNGAGTIRNNATATASTLTIDTTAGNGSFSGAITDHSAGTGTVAFTKIGLGTQTLSGANSYTGSTTISKGTLALVGGGSIANSASINVAKDATLDVASKTGGFTVGSGQTLTNNGGVTGNVIVSGQLNGTGTITGDVSLVGGILAPGNSPGIQTITGSLTLDANSIMDMQLRKDSTTSSLSLIAGTDYDQVAVGGALNLAGTLNLDINWGLQSTDVFMLILNSSSVGVSGSFSTLTINGVKANDFANNSFIYNGQEYTLRYVNADSGTVANDLELIAVPEPGSWAMIAGGLGMLLGAQRMRRRSA